jgi:hypothetical protein
MLKPNPWLGKKLLMAAVLIGVGVGSFCWGRRHASATTPESDPVQAAANGGGGTRVVAYVNDQPVFREELGEYLIARLGADRLPFLVNRKIVEMECRKHNIVVTDEDVNYRFQQELKTFGGGVALSEADFVNNILRRFNKTLYEWKEDVIRPKIMMEYLVRGSIKITDADVRDGFEARYGPKVECRMIVLDKNERRVQEVWDKVKNSPEAFLKAAKEQGIPNLATAGGLVPPIHKHFGDKGLEDAAFRLRPGEVSSPVQMKDESWVILMCERHVPENKLVRFEEERMKVHKEVEELRVAQKIPEVFKKLHDEARMVLMLRPEGSPVSVRSEPPMPKVQPPVGQGPVQMPPNTPPPPPPGLAPPSATPGK